MAGPCSADTRHCRLLPFQGRADLRKHYAQRWACVKVIASYVPALIGLCTGTFWPFGSRAGTANARLMAKKKNPAAVALGRKGGKAAAERLTEEQRKEKARKAAQARWTNRHK
jgi:hypothetical protein